MGNNVLNFLLEQIRKQFRIKPKQKCDMVSFSLIYWQRGYWSIKVTDDWHKWLDAKIEEPDLLYKTPEDACIGFLRFIEKNKINIKKLQSK